VIEGLADLDRRRRIAASQRAAVAERFGYTAGMKRMIDWIRTLVLCESSV
jgi:hypothetical protein